jgi:hypothetical protein
MPRIDFPRFEGEHPWIWKEKCEKYLLMCGVPQELWAPFATMHFHSHASYWLQTFEAQHCHTRFYKENRMHLICAPGSFTHT